MTRIRFEEVAVKGVWRWTDTAGKKHQQTRKFFQTMSPFNRDAAGFPKSRQQIIAEISAERKAWLEFSASGAESALRNLAPAPKEE